MKTISFWVKSRPLPLVAASPGTGLVLPAAVEVACAAAWLKLYLELMLPCS